MATQFEKLKLLNAHVSSKSLPPETAPRSRIVEIKKNLLQIDPTRELVWDQVFATTDIDNSDLRELWTEVQREDCVHSWKNLELNLDANAREELLLLENRWRPSCLIGYYGQKGQNKPKLLGVAMIADSVNHRFPHSCFPVVARCFIRKSFRNYKLYREILIHRIQLIHDLWGSGLKGIHMGSASPKVLNLIQSNSFPYRFLYLGNEKLTGCGLEVQDFLYVTEEFKRQLLKWQPSHLHESAKEIQGLIRKFLNGSFTVKDCGSLVRNFQRAEADLLMESLVVSP